MRAFEVSLPKPQNRSPHDIRRPEEIPQHVMEQGVSLGKHQVKLMVEAGVEMEPRHGVVVRPPVQNGHIPQLLLDLVAEEALVVVVVVVHQVDEDEVVGDCVRDGDIGGAIPEVEPKLMLVLPRHCVDPTVVETLW